MTILLKTDFSDAQVLPTENPQWDKLVIPAGEIPIMYEAGTSADRSAVITSDDKLQFALSNAAIPGDREGYYKGRVQANISVPNLETVTMKTSVLLDFEAYRDYPKANDWLTTIELWAGAASSKYPFRISLNLAKEFGAGKPVYFSVAGSQRGSSGKWFQAWKNSNKTIRPNFNEGLELELSYRMGNARTGRFSLSMNGESVFRIMNRTYHSGSPKPVPLTMIQPKLYTSGAVIDHIRETSGAARILWDNWEIST